MHHLNKNLDHGKSTLADRLLEITNTVPERHMQNQILDNLAIERERGITIKLQVILTVWKFWNLINFNH